MFIISSRALHLLGEREGAGVERVGELLVVLGDHARPGAAGAVEFDQLDVEQRRDLGHRAVQLRREAAAHAAGPVGDLHALVLPSGLSGAACCDALGLDARPRPSPHRSAVFVDADDVEVELIALRAALDLLVDRLHALAGRSLGILCGFRAPVGVTLRRISALTIDGSELMQLFAGGRVEFAEPRVAAVGARKQLGLPQQAVVLDQRR